MPATAGPSVAVAAPKRAGKKTANLKARSARMSLPPGRSGFIVLGDGIALAYYRPKVATAPGQWLARRRLADGTYPIARIGTADDLDTADGAEVLDYAQAIAKALGRDERTAAAASVTVAAACEAYAVALDARPGRAAQEARAAFRKHLGDLAGRKVRDLTERHAASAAKRIPDRVRTSIKAALGALAGPDRPAAAILRAFNLPAAAVMHSPGMDDEGAALGADDVLTQAEAAEVVAKARAHDPAFGRFVAVLHATGARPSQVARCRVMDLRDDVLLIAPSAKGKPGKPKAWARIPLAAALAEEMRAACAGRAKDALLLPRVQHERTMGGNGWKVAGEAPWDRIAWSRAARAAGIATGLYSLRHHRVVRLALAGIPLRLIAAALDTSVAMLERVYSRHIGAQGDDLLRAAADAA